LNFFTVIAVDTNQKWKYVKRKFLPRGQKSDLKVNLLYPGYTRNFNLRIKVFKKDGNYLKIEQS